jgi:hypothetical protein
MILPAALRSGEQDIDEYLSNGEGESCASESSDLSEWRDDTSIDTGNDGGVGIGGVKTTKQQRALPIELAALGQGNRDGDDRRRSRSVA